MKKWRPYLIRVSIGLFLVGLVIWSFADWTTLWQTLQQVQLVYLIGPIIIYYSGVWLSCVKWQWLLQAQQQPASIGRLMRWYLIGALANTFLPSDVGGDLGRGYLSGRATGNHLAAWSSVIAERLTGVIALFLLTALVLVLAPTLLGWSPLLPLGILGFGGLAGMLGIVGLRSGTDRLTWLPAAIRGKLEHIQDVLNRYQHRPDILFGCILLSLVFHLINMLSLWIVLLAVSPDDAPLQAALVAPLVGLVGLLPLTPGGLGVREGVLVALLERSDILAADAVAVALVSRVLLLLVSLSGALPLVAEPQHTTRYQEDTP